MFQTDKEANIFLEIIHQSYALLFYKKWPFWIGGLLIGLLSILTFAWARPLGVAGGLKYWGDCFFSFIGVYEAKKISPFFSAASVLTLGLLWGAFGSALMSKQFAIRTAPVLELLKGIIGGFLMGIGAAMAKGCNVGGFYAAVSAMSLGGISMMFGLFIGAYLGIRYLYWELEHLPSALIHGKPIVKKNRKFDWLSLEPVLGGLVFLAAFAAMLLYVRAAYTQIGGLLLCGIAFGVIIQRSRFCFVRCFRDPFVTGEGDMARALSFSIMISLMGFAILKWTGSRGELVYVARSFWSGGLIGGIIFGCGMVIAGGCGSGSIWRAAEGHVKLILCVIAFSLTTSVFNRLIQSYPDFMKLMGKKVFLPEYITYGWSVVLLLLFFCSFLLFITWNEKTERFTIEM